MKKGRQDRIAETLTTKETCVEECNVIPIPFCLLSPPLVVMTIAP